MLTGDPVAGPALLPHMFLGLLRELVRHSGKRHHTQHGDRQESAEDEENKDAAGDTAVEKIPFDLHKPSAAKTPRLSQQSCRRSHE